MDEQTSNQNSISISTTNSHEFSIATESDARAVIRMCLANMTYTDLFDCLNKLPAFEEREWLLNLIFEELEYLHEKTCN